MRLQVAERPDRRDVREASQRRKLGTELRRVSGDDENVEWQFFRGGSGLETAVASCEIETPQWPVPENRPAFGAGDPGNRHSTANLRKLRPTLAVGHRINRAPPVELMVSFAQPEERTSTAGKCDCARASVHLQFLNDFPCL